MKRNLRILITGKNRSIVRDICNHLELDRGYMPIMCKPDQAAIYDAVCSDLPNVVIIAMGSDSAGEIAAFDVLAEACEKGMITVIVIATEADKKSFINHTRLSKLYFLSRPVSLFVLYGKLNVIEEEYEKKDGNASFLMEEYFSPLRDGSSKRRHILVVDDDSEQLMQIKGFLSEFYDVTPVKSGKDAFRFFTKRTADLILLDYMMPEMDGPEVLTKLRTMDEAKDIPVMFLTGVSEKSMVIKTITELLPQGYIVKPTKKSELVAKIIEALDERSSYGQ